MSDDTRVPVGVFVAIILLIGGLVLWRTRGPVFPDPAPASGAVPSDTARRDGTVAPPNVPTNAQ